MNASLAGVLQGIDLLDTAPERSRYITDSLLPDLVALPGTEAEVARCLLAASEGGIAVAPRGGGTRDGLGNPLRRCGLVLSMERMNQVLEYVPEDLTITVQPGIRLAELQAVAARHGQFLPVDPPRAAQSTIGGIVATACAGPHRMAWGAVRDLVLGTRLALLDGRVIRTGGRVVKNVAGYDLNKLVTGSLGTLGVITEVTLRLRPLPEVSRTVCFGFASAEAALAAAEACLQSELLPAALVLLSEGAAHRLQVPGPAALAVHLTETEANVAYQEQRLQELVRPLEPAQDTLSGAAESAFWEGVRDYGERSRAALRARVNTVISDLGEQHLHLAELPSGMAAETVSLVDSGTVLVYGFDAGAGPDGLQAFAAALLARASAAGGSAMLEQAPRAVRAALDVWGPPRPEWRLMHSLKQTFDPGGLLNPGRLAGGM